MAVIDLRGDVQRSLASIGISIGQIARPNKKEKKEFRDLIARNPQLVGAFSRLERQSPGSVSEIFPFLDEETISNITSAPPSADELAEAIGIPALTPVEQGGTLTPETAGVMGEFAAAGRVGATPSGLALEPKKVAAAGEITQEDVTAGLRRDVTGLTPGQTAQDKFNTDIFTTADAAFDDLSIEDKEKAALRAKLPATFFDADNQEMFRQRKAIAQMQIDAQNLQRANERTDAFQRSIGARWTERTKTGTPETWQLFLFTQEMNERGKGLANQSILPQNQTDIRLMEVAQAFSRTDQVDKITEEAAVRTQIRAIIERIGRKFEGSFANERTVRQVLVEQLNSAFVELSMLTDGRIPVRIGEIPDRFGPGKGNEPLKIRDEFGEEIEIGQEVEKFQQGEQVEEAGPLNLETVDVSKLPEKTRNNLIAIMNGQGTFEELQAFDPVSAQLILDARRNR